MKPPEMPRKKEKMKMKGKMDLKKKHSEAEVKSTIKLKEWSPDLIYLNNIANSSNPYETYLKEKSKMRDYPAFYLDFCNFFFKKLKNKDFGLRVLSIVSELELNNPQLYRIVENKPNEESTLLKLIRYLKGC